METSLARAYEAVNHATHVTADPVTGSDGIWGLAIVANDCYFFVPKKDQEEWDRFVSSLVKKTLIVYDVRRIMTWPLSSSTPVIDVKLIYGGDQSLGKLMRERFNTSSGVFGRFNELEQKMLAHARAAKTAHLGHLAVVEVVPKDVLADWVKARVVTIRDLWTRSQLSSAPEGALLEEVENRWPFILALREVERAGIHVDIDAVNRLLPDARSANAATLRSMQGLTHGGIAHSLFNPIGTKTGRLKIEAGLNVLAIPNDTCRQAITSRFDDGLIYTFDFNAIDYRCIVRSIGGDFAKNYDGMSDFHDRTTRFLFSQSSSMRRKLIKAISYAYIYGGSVETIIETTGLERQLVEIALKKLDEHIHPIAEFRESLYIQAQKDGYVEPPGGRRVYVYPDDHPGKVLGLYAQTYSSWVFEQAFTAVHQLLKELGTGSTIIFSVHDELVIDMRKEDGDEVAERIKRVMEQAGGGGWTVRVKKGANYGEQTERRTDPEEQGSHREADPVVT